MKLPAVSDASRELVVNEMFGPTFQGEGPSTGRRARFIRLFGCHLSCSFCDSAQTYDSTRFDLIAEQQIITTETVLRWLDSDPPGLVVITGGEPLLQPRALGALVGAIRDRGLATDVEIETSGTVAATPEVVAGVTAFNVSPKLAHSALRRHQRIRPAVLRQFLATNKAIWKFVVADPADLDEVQELVATYDLHPIWIMPEGTDSATILTRMRLLADPVLARGWNFSGRLHTLLWENDRAR